jgi:hypothetical protein
MSGVHHRGAADRHDDEAGSELGLMPNPSSPSAKMVGNMMDMKKLVATSAQMLGKPPITAARQHSAMLQPAIEHQLARRIDGPLQPGAEETADTKSDHGRFQIDLRPDALRHICGLLREVHNRLQVPTWAPT